MKTIHILQDLSLDLERTLDIERLCMTENAKNILDKLRQKPCDHFELVTIAKSHSNLHKIITELRSNGFSIERIDAGGNPTWRLSE